MTDQNSTPDNDALKAERLSRIGPATQTPKINKNYTRRIRRLAMILPIIALLMIMVIFNWNSFKDDAISPLQEEAKAVAKQTIGKNELLNPQFESTDDKGQPFTITANRATQDQSDEDLVVLENPSGALTLEDGANLTIKATNGQYRQVAQRIFLQDNVVMTHQEQNDRRGYQLTTQELHVDMAANAAWSGVDVNAQGPIGTLQAKGMKASSTEETLIFTGPAKLTLMLDSGINIGDVNP